MTFPAWHSNDDEVNDHALTSAINRRAAASDLTDLGRDRPKRSVADSEAASASTPVAKAVQS